jgi:hypothetical protein
VGAAGTVDAWRKRAQNRAVRLITGTDVTERNRVAALEGSLDVDSPPGGGTRPHAELPLSPETVSDTSAVWARERCVPRCQTPGAGLEPVSDTVKVGAVSDTLKGEFSAAVDQGQSADDSTSPAATGLSSMYRTAA